MSRRLAFLTGHLSGLLLGAVVVFILFSSRSIPDRPALNLLPAGPTITPVSHPMLSNGWELRYFNGHPYYIVPLEAAVPAECGGIGQEI